MTQQKSQAVPGHYYEKLQKATGENRIILVKAKLLVLFVTIQLTSQAQGSTWCQEKTDKMTGQTSWTSTDLAIRDTAGQGFTITFVVLDPANVLMNFTLAGHRIRCVDDADEIKILFRDGSRMVLNNHAGFNCLAQSVAWFGDVYGNKKEFAQILAKEVQTIRIDGRNNIEQQDFTSEESKQLQQMAQCISSKFGK